MRAQNQSGDILIIAVHTNLRIYPLRTFNVPVLRGVSSIYFSLSENAEGCKLPAQLFNYRKLANHIGLFSITCSLENDIGCYSRAFFAFLIYTFGGDLKGTGGKKENLKGNAL